jgi:hypothetical protein
MNWHPNWVVRETELDASRPCPVCLIDRTRVQFRFSESQQASLHLSTEAAPVFRMLKRPKRDVFEFSDGKQITLGDLPAGLIFDVLVVPSSEQLSTLLELEIEPAVQHEEEEREKEPLLVRLQPLGTLRPLMASLFQRLEYDDEVRVGLAHVLSQALLLFRGQGWDGSVNTSPAKQFWFCYRILGRLPAST